MNSLNRMARVVDGRNVFAASLCFAVLVGCGVGKPGAPSGLKATASDRQVTLTWTPPTGSAKILSYVVSSLYYQGSQHADLLPVGAGTSTVISNLSNGVPYTFKLQAVDAAGTGPLSNPSNTVTPFSSPLKPSQVVAAAGNASATVSFLPPANTGGLAISSYIVTGTPGNAMLTLNGTQTSGTILGLTNGTSYTFSVAAVNSAGAVAVSDPSNAVVPAGTPDAPTQVSAVAGNGLAVVSWTAPADTGGVSLTAYVVISSPENHTSTIAPGALNSGVVSGLTNGGSYTFVVVAQNAVTTSLSSAPSSAVTPSASANAPMIVLPSTFSNSTIPKGFTGPFKITNSLLIQGPLPALTPPYDRWDEFYFIDCTNCADGSHHANFEGPVSGATLAGASCPTYDSWSVSPAIYSQPFCYYSPSQGVVSPDYISSLTPGNYAVQLGFVQIDGSSPGPPLPLIAGPGVTGGDRYLVGSFTVTP